MDIKYNWLKGLNRFGVGEMKNGIKVNLRVLMVDDSDEDVARLKMELENGGFNPITKVVKNEVDLSSMLDNELWDVILADYITTDFNAIQAFKKLKEKEVDIPFIIISDEISEEAAVEAMLAGASDFITKSKLTRLVPAIQRELRDSVERRSRKLAERRLKESEEQFSKFMKYFPAAVFMKDREGRILFMNEYAEITYGWKLDKVIGKRERDLLPPELGEKIRKSDEKVIKEGRMIEYTSESVIQGKKVVHNTYKFPIFRDGQPDIIGGISLDITKRHEAERKLEVSREKLSQERERLEKKNIALAEMLNQFERQKSDIQTQMATNIEETILPNLQRLKETATAQQERLFELLERDLQEIASPFLNNLKHKFTKLSPRELEVCRMIKSGLTSKEIAEALRLAPATVHKHRELIRKKLGLVNKEENLNTFLKTMQE